MWTKISEQKDLISYKKSANDKTVIIEARFDNDIWKIYKTYQINGKNKLVREYNTNSRDSAMTIIEDLKKEKDISVRSIIDLSKKEREPLNLKLKREYKEYDVEKWSFSINNEKRVNVIIIRYADELIIDFILHEKYRNVERKIIKNIFSTLNLDDFIGSVNQNIYYFIDESHYRKDEKKGFLIGKIEMDLSEE
ncbi:MAG: hypothetical protein V1740_07935 [Candidatus Woesearchaeota archaeon]